MDSGTEIANVVARWFAAVDGRDWPAALALMADPFHLDYESLSGEPGGLRAPAEVIAAWADFLPGFDHTHHQLGNLDISLTGSGARVRCLVTARHHIGGAAGGPVWMVVGSYEIGLKPAGAGWQLDACRLMLRFQEGNTGLPRLAGERMKARATAAGSA